MLALFVLGFGLFGQWLLGTLVADLVLTLQANRGNKPGHSSENNARSNPTIDDERVVTMTELSGLGIVFGIGVTAWLLFIWSFFGGLLGPIPSSLVASLGYLAGGPILLYRLRKRRTDSQLDSLKPDGDRQEQALRLACQWLIAGLSFFAILQTLQTPQKLWDERAIFAIKAKVLFEDRSIFSSALAHPDFVQYHPRYPLLLPLAEQNIYAFLGAIGDRPLISSGQSKNQGIDIPRSPDSAVNDRISKLIFPLLYIGLVLTTAGVLLRHFSSGRAWFGALLMATVPVLMPYEYGFLCGQADAPMSCFHGLSVLYLWDGFMRWHRHQSGIGSFSIAGICGGLAAFTKDEGIAFLMIDAAILGLIVFATLIRRDRFRRTVVSAGMYVVVAALILAPWFSHRRGLPITTEMNYFGRMTVKLFVSRLDTLFWSVPHLIHRMFSEWREWGLQWWLMLGAFVCRPHRATRPSQLLLLLDIAGGLAAIVVAGMLAPAQLDEHIGGSSHRFLMQIAPVAVLFAVTQYFDDDDDHSNPSISRL